MAVQTNDARAMLEHERAEAVEHIASLSQQFDEVVESIVDVANDDEHDPEGHTIAVERQQLAGLLRDARLHLTEVNEAVGRLGDGTYGLCEDCGSPVRAERLAALPATRTCVECAI